jgi:hypothetical protein
MLRLRWLSVTFYAIASIYCPLDFKPVHIMPDILQGVYVNAGQNLVRSSSQHNLLDEFRKEMGNYLIELHKFLFAHLKDEPSCLEIATEAIVYWMFNYSNRFGEVEAADNNYKINAEIYRKVGYLKRQPRQVLILRAYLYHLQRRSYNRYYAEMDDIERKLASRILIACTSSSYPLIRM